VLEPPLGDLLLRPPGPRVVLLAHRRIRCHGVLRRLRGRGCC
jgi:hypothetical protein